MILSHISTVEEHAGAVMSYLSIFFVIFDDRVGADDGVALRRTCVQVSPGAVSSERLIFYDPSLILKP